VRQAPLPAADARGRPELAPDAAFVASPARRLQQDLHFAYGCETEARWSPRRTLGFLLLTNGLAWAGLIYGVAQLT
jgi:hypothetical protein